MNLATVVATVTYKPDWKVSLHTMNDIPHLWVEAVVPNSNPPHEPTRIGHVLQVPPFVEDHPDEFFLRRWVYDQLLAVERHELGEWLRFGDERPFFPSHDGAPDRYEEPAR